MTSIVCIIENEQMFLGCRLADLPGQALNFTTSFESWDREGTPLQRHWVFTRKSRLMFISRERQVTLPEPKICNVFIGRQRIDNDFGFLP
jgi:hypothetical protein